MWVKSIIALCLFLMVAGCTVTIDTPPNTQIKAQNTLTNFSASVDGKSTNIDAIDLKDVQIGDVTFSSIPGGTTSITKITNRTGNVSINIGEAVAWVTVLGSQVSVPITNIDPMSTDIEKGITNTVTFSDETAKVVLNALAKKKVITD